MNDQLNDVEWSLMNNLSVQEAWTFFYTTYEKAMEQFIPKSVPTKDRRKKLWMNRTALSLHKKNRQAWMKYKQTKSCADHVRATQLKNELSRLTRSLCREFERDLARNIKTNPKAFQRYGNSKLKNKPRLRDLKNIEGAVVQGDKEKMDLLNEYFASVYTQENIENLPSFESKYDGPPFSKPYITVDTVRKQLLKLNVNKANGPDGLHPPVLRETAALISKPMCHLPEVTRQQLLAQELEGQQYNANTQEGQQNSSRQLQTGQYQAS